MAFLHWKRNAAIWEPESNNKRPPYGNCFTKSAALSSNWQSSSSILFTRYLLRRLSLPYACGSQWAMTGQRGRRRPWRSSLFALGRDGGCRERSSGAGPCRSLPGKPAAVGGALVDLPAGTRAKGDYSAGRGTSGRASGCTTGSGASPARSSGPRGRRCRAGRPSRAGSVRGLFEPVGASRFAGRPWRDPFAAPARERAGCR